MWVNAALLSGHSHQGKNALEQLSQGRPEERTDSGEPSELAQVHDAVANVSPDREDALGHTVSWMREQTSRWEVSVCALVLLVAGSLSLWLSAENIRTEVAE